MITASVSDIQKNPTIISQAKGPINVVDKRKNIDIGVFYPKLRKKSIVKELAGSLGKYISEDKKDIPFDVVRKKAYQIKLEEINKKYRS